MLYKPPNYSGMLFSQFLQRSPPPGVNLRYDLWGVCSFFVHLSHLLSLARLFDSVAEELNNALGTDFPKRPSLFGGRAFSEAIQQRCCVVIIRLRLFAQRGTLGR